MESLQRASCCARADSNLAGREGLSSPAQSALSSERPCSSHAQMQPVCSDRCVLRWISVISERRDWHRGTSVRPPSSARIALAVALRQDLDLTCISRRVDRDRGGVDDDRAPVLPEADARPVAGGGLGLVLGGHLGDGAAVLGAPGLKHGRLGVPAQRVQSRDVLSESSSSRRPRRRIAFSAREGSPARTETSRDITGCDATGPAS